MRVSRSALFISLAISIAATVLAPRDAVAQDAAEPLRANYRGWDYIVEKLVADGVDRRRVHRAFTDPRVEPFAGLDFGLAPREPRSLYQGFASSTSVAHARRCKAAHAAALDAAERAHGVPASVVASIIHIESGCGRNTGSEVVLYRLARLAMANEPANLRSNIDRHTGGLDDPEIESRTRQRGQYLEDTFYPEVLATFQLADRLDMDPLSLRGSGSGAFGMPQFLPRSYLSYGSDGNGDGRISLYEPDDAIFSCANYLASHGWRDGLSRADRRRVIWHYNRSDAYIDAVLTLADRLDGAPEVETASVTPPAARKAAPRAGAGASVKKAKKKSASTKKTVPAKTKTTAGAAKKPGRTAN
jgi:membrane-bound lytic murein transglycosylase B